MNDAVALNLQTQTSRRKKRLIFLLAIPCLIILLSLTLYLHGGRYAETDNAYLKADKVAITSELSGRVTQVLVHENEQVKAGDTLVQIDPINYQLAIANAQAALDDVKTNLLALKAQYRSKLAEIAMVESQYEFHQREQKRQQNLEQKKYLSASQYDDAKQKTQIDLLNITTLKNELQQIKASLGGNIDLPIEQHPKYLVYQAELNQAKVNLAHTRIIAPFDGVVTQVTKLGQYMKAGSMAMVLVANKALWIEANFTEKELTHVQQGQPVEISVDLAPDYVWKGQVESLSPATGSEFSVIPAQNGTGNWVKVAQRLAVRIQIKQQPDAPILRAGLSAQVSIDTGYKRHFAGLSL